MERGAIIEFDVRTPLSRDGLRSNVAWALAEGFPEVESAPDRPETVNIIANGPSALNAPQDGLTVALNGAHRLFRKAPTWWAACDPQGLVADFVNRPFLETQYLVASKCDRRVFDALWGMDVRVWHIDDCEDVPWSVPSATSITLTALSLFRRMGYRDFRVWGWDGCYVDGRDHAVPQLHSAERITVRVGGKSFETTPTWAAEAQDAVNQLAGADYRVRIEGDGMIKAVVGALVPDCGLAA